MTELLTWLSASLQGGTALALTGAFLWGVASMVLSPCHLASIPLLVGFVNGQGRTTPARGLALSSFFALGLLITIGLVGALTAAAGRMAGDLGSGVNYALALVFLGVGLHLVGALPFPEFQPATVRFRRHGLLAALLLGLVFGLALGPCTFAFMAPVLGVTFRTATTSPALALLLLLAFGIGHCSLIVAAGTAVGRVQSYLDWNQRSNGTAKIRVVCGVAMVLAGLYLLATA